MALGCPHCGRTHGVGEHLLRHRSSAPRGRSAVGWRHSVSARRVAGVGSGSTAADRIVVVALLRARCAHRRRAECVGLRGCPAASLESGGNTDVDLGGVNVAVELADPASASATGCGVGCCHRNRGRGGHDGLRSRPHRSVGSGGLDRGHAVLHARLCTDGKVGW